MAAYKTTRATALEVNLIANGGKAADAKNTDNDSTNPLCNPQTNRRKTFKHAALPRVEFWLCLVMMVGFLSYMMYRTSVISKGRIHNLGRMCKIYHKTIYNTELTCRKITCKRLVSCKLYSLLIFRFLCYFEKIYNMFNVCI